MNIKQNPEPKEYRKAARNLFATVSKLLDEAVLTNDMEKRRALYLQAMKMSNNAYDLLGKARESGAKKQVG